MLTDGKNTYPNDALSVQGVSGTAASKHRTDIHPPRLPAILCPAVEPFRDVALPEPDQFAQLYVWYEALMRPLVDGGFLHT